jgi:phage/plasmid-associated DNA primase
MGSRIMVADFRHRFEGAAEDKSLYGKLAAEKEGILSILVWAAEAWYRSWEAGGHGITLPARVVEQSAAFIERNDPVAECLREAFVTRPDAECAGKIAYDTYVEWHARSGLEGDPMSNVKFAAALEKKGMQKARRIAGVFWTGLKPLSALDIAESEGDE